MAFTRKMLKALGIEDDKVEQIIDAHSEVVDALKEQRDKYKEDAEKLPGVQKELDDLKAENSDGGYKKKYEDERKAFADYKKDVEGKAAAETKAKAARVYFEGKGISGNNLEIAMMAAKSVIDGLALDGEKIKDAKALDDLVGGTLAALVGKEKTTGANPANPPQNTGGGKMTKEQIIAIKDSAARQKAIAENHELFGF